MTLKELKQQIQNLSDDFEIQIIAIDANENYSSFTATDISLDIDKSINEIQFFGVIDRG